MWQTADASHRRGWRLTCRRRDRAGFDYVVGRVQHDVASRTGVPLRVRPEQRGLLWGRRLCEPLDGGSHEQRSLDGPHLSRVPVRLLARPSPRLTAVERVVVNMQDHFHITRFRQLDLVVAGGYFKMPRTDCPGTLER